MVIANPANKAVAPVEVKNVPPPFGSPSYHSQDAPVPNEPPLIVKSTVPVPHILVIEGVKELGSIEISSIVIVTVSELSGQTVPNTV